VIYNLLMGTLNATHSLLRFHTQFNLLRTDSGGTLSWELATQHRCSLVAATTMQFLESVTYSLVSGLLQQARRSGQPVA